MPDRLLVPRRQAADDVGLPLRTFERLERAGQGPPRVWVRRRIYYRASDLAAWVAGLGDEEVTP